MPIREGGEVMPKITIYKCAVDGEFEFTEELKEAHCPKCGVIMTKTGFFDEA